MKQFEDIFNYLTPGDNVTLSEKGWNHFKRWDDSKPTEGVVGGCWNNDKYIHVKLEGIPYMLGYRRDFWELA